MNPTILITVRGGCVVNVQADGDMNVVLLDLDCGEGEVFFPPIEVMPTEKLTEQINTLKTR